MAKPTFSKSGVDTWTPAKAEAVPYRRLPVPIQRAGEAEDGSVQVRNLGGVVYWIPLRFVRLSQADFDALVAFFSDGNVNWSLHSFTYTDYGGNARTVHLWPGSFDFDMEPSGIYTVSMRLREV